MGDKRQNEHPTRYPCGPQDAAQVRAMLSLWPSVCWSCSTGPCDQLVRECTRLPSFTEAYTASTPLTRIRDIAHRNDIPHELKQEIKHTIQVHRQRTSPVQNLTHRYLHRPMLATVCRSLLV